MIPLLAPVLLLVAMHWSAQFLARQSSGLFGRRLQLYLFGLLGTIVHEGSHVIACVLFRHRVHRVKWFDAQATDGALGSVEHSYDPTSAYQRVGTVVIGIAPLVVGAVVILFAAQRLLGLTPPVAWSVSTWSVSAWQVDDVPMWRWALFAYVSISVGGSMHLSASDVRGTWRGVVTLAIWSAAALLATALLWWVLQHVAPFVWDSSVVPRWRDALRHLTRISESLAIAMLLAIAINTLCAVLLMLPRLASARAR
ncbi:hypothetical protein [Gemmatimonas groenlandica]|uniref:Uncharacterized protein n=1 Tax=Gemmatimonas groenlandica TaxID=2732249 RepID=A0A6M4ISM6_9BACT|nr:hypothetical protein [Gemmatimonas groenlandica]QJR36547.1 hypothetical protein HKW67_14040 [Gemmatimonas groenlandica]